MPIGHSPEYEEIPDILNGYSQNLVEMANTAEEIRKFIIRAELGSILEEHFLSLENRILRANIAILNQAIEVKNLIEETKIK